MKKKLPKIRTIEYLEQLHTKSLLAYLKRLHKCEESFKDSDMDINIDLEDEETIYFKQTHKWKSAYRNVKAILKNREHIE